MVRPAEYYGAVAPIVTARERAGMEAGWSSVDVTPLSRDASRVGKWLGMLRSWSAASSNGGASQVPQAAHSRGAAPAAARQCDARLVDALCDLEKIFFSEPWSDLRGYYSESYLGLRSLPEQQEDSLRLRHVVMLQARLMEEAYHALRLQQCADDPSNRGWMNLFRRWGASPTFNSWFDLIRIMFALDFVTFYDEHLRHQAATSDLIAPRDAYDTDPHLVRAPSTSPAT